MKKVLALVLAAVMTLSLSTVVSALTVDGDEPSTVGSSEFSEYTTANFDGEDFETTVTPGAGFTAVDGAFSTDGFTVSANVTSSNPDMLKASLDIDDVTNGKTITLKLEPADSYFTVEEHDVKVKLVVVQKKNDTTPAAKFEEEYTVTLSNKTHGEADFFENASGKIVSAVGDLENPVIEEDVFTGIADGKALELNYGDYSVNFAKVNNQNTALYLKADTDVADGSKAIASIAFQPTRVKDAATISMPISADDENLYGEKVFVYALVDGKPSGEAIEGTVVNHNSVIFTVPAGTTLGAWAAYGDKATGDAEKPAIPETGANDIVNIAIVFAVVALAAAGFVAVKKASK